MRALALFALLGGAAASPYKPGPCSSAKPTVTRPPVPPTTPGPSRTRTRTTTTTAATTSPAPTNTPVPNNATTAENTWGRGFIDRADFIEGSYIDGYEYLDWAWALIYRPEGNGTFCLSTYTQEGQAAAMVAYLADSGDAGSAALVAGVSTVRVGAACVSGLDESCVDYWTQWGNLTMSGRGTHCYARGDASHGPGVE